MNSAPPLLETTDVALDIDETTYRFDVQIGDEDLEVSLIVASLEEQYENMQNEDNVQGTRDWIRANSDKVAGFFRSFNQAREF